MPTRRRHALLFSGTDKHAPVCSFSLSQAERSRLIPLRELLTTITRHGLSNLYRGFAATLCRSILGNVAAFSCYNGCCSQGVPVAVAGGLAGVAFWTGMLALWQNTRGMKGKGKPVLIHVILLAQVQGMPV
jgi:hypothetical protein